MRTSIFSPWRLFTLCTAKAERQVKKTSCRFFGDSVFCCICVCMMNEWELEGMKVGKKRKINYKRIFLYWDWMVVSWLDFLLLSASFYPLFFTDNNTTLLLPWWLWHYYLSILWSDLVFPFVVIFRFLFIISTTPRQRSDKDAMHLTTVNFRTFPI